MQLSLVLFVLTLIAGVPAAPNPLHLDVSVNEDCSESSSQEPPLEHIQVPINKQTLQKGGVLKTLSSEILGVCPSGRGTVYGQQGGTGSCGQRFPDGAAIAAIGFNWMGRQWPPAKCGANIKITNVGSPEGIGGTGRSIVVPVVDTCGSCGPCDVDVSYGTWNALTGGAYPGVITVTWDFV